VFHEKASNIGRMFSGCRRHSADRRALNIADGSNDIKAEDRFSKKLLLTEELPT
jgi:hypothetical protein